MRWLKQLFFPEQCVRCGKYGSQLCPACITNIPMLFPHCFYCQGSTPKGYTHSNCWLPDQEQPVQRARILFPYHSEIKVIIGRLKYRQETSVSNIVKALIKHYLQDWDGLCQYELVPVPLHPQRLKERGFNQAEIIAQCLQDALLQRFNIQSSINSKLISREKYTAPQARQKSEQRVANVFGAFSLLTETRINSRIVIVDDVVSSGSTINAVASELSNICKHIEVFALARG